MPRIYFSTYILYIALCVLPFLQCRKKDITEEKSVVVEDNTLIVNSFNLEKKNNPHLNDDVVFDIQGNTMTGNNLNVFYPKAIPTFATNAASVEINAKPQISAVSAIDMRQNIVYTLISAKGTKKQYTLKVNWDDNLTQLDIQTKGNIPIVSNQTYIEGTVSIDGRKIYSDYTGSVQIRGRGNSTWNMPKKPYRFKLDNKAALLGLAAEKDWVLLANYLDGLHILNAVAMKTGKLLNMPFTNTIIPVEMSLNGQYQGFYMFTEQIEIKNNRVNIGNDGILLSLDTNFDEIWKFKSANYQLPVMIKDPELNSADEVTPIKEEFDRFEALVAQPNFPNNNYLDYFDGEAFANYMIVYILMSNEELNHPKSTYIYKPKVGKYTMGPIWDFDWAFGFEKTNVYFSNPTKPLFWSPQSTGTRFFSKIMTDPKIKTLVKQKWADFRANKFNDLLTYIDEYAFLIEGARNRDYQKWRRGSANFKGDIATLKTWLQSRANYMNTYVNGL